MGDSDGCAGVCFGQPQPSDGKAGEVRAWRDALHRFRQARCLAFTLNGHAASTMHERTALTGGPTGV